MKQPTESGARLQWRLRFIVDEEIAFGPGKIALLESIEQTGSITRAAREHNMSYRRAWILVDELNRCFDEPVVVTATGGRAGGGAALTDLGREIAEHYREAEEAATRAARAHLQAIMAHLRAPGAGDTEQ